MGSWGTTPSEEESLAPLADVIVAALIAAGVVVVGGVVQWIYDNQDDVKVQGVSIVTSTAVPSHCGIDGKDTCADDGWSWASCSTDVINSCGEARTRNYAYEPVFGKDVLSPWIGGYAKLIHEPYEPEEHKIFAESKVQIDNTVRTKATPAQVSPHSSSSHPDGTVLGTIEIDDFKVQVRGSSAKTSSWDINFVATPKDSSPVQVFHSSGVLDSNGEILNLAGDIPRNQLTPSFNSDSLWTIEFTGYSDEVVLGFLNPGDSTEVEMHADATMELNDARQGTGPGARCFDFDPYCDGLELGKNGRNIFGYWRNTDCAGADVEVIGRVVGREGRVKGDVAGYTWGFVIDGLDGTMDMYQQSGGWTLWIDELLYDGYSGPCLFDESSSMSSTMAK